MADFYSGWVVPPNGKAAYRTHLSVKVVAQDIAANTSTLEYVGTLEKDRWFQGFYGYSGASWSIVINGTTVVSGSGTSPNAPWEAWTTHPIGSGRITVTHGTDGTKTGMGVAITFAGPNNGWAIGTAAVSTTMNLPVIPRATTPTITPSPAAVGAIVAITLPRASTSYTHDLTWVCGASSGSIGTGIATSTTWTVPSVMSEYPGRLLVPIVITAVTKLGATVVGTKQVTLFARTPPAAPTVAVRDPFKQFDIRARLVEYNGGTWAATRPIPANTIQLVDSASATTTCTIAVSALNAVDFADFSIVDVDVFDGTNWVYTNHRFVLSRLDGDEIDATKMKTYSGSEFVDYNLGFGYAQKDYEWTSTTPGQILATIITDAKARAWGPRIGMDFTASVTSLSEPWINTGMARKVAKGTPISQVLSGLVDDGLVEYRTEYRSNNAYLVLLNPGTGSDFSAVGASPVVNLSLAALSRAPRRASIEKRLTRVTVTGDDKVQITREKTPFDSDVFGQMEGWVSASGVATNAQAQTIGDNALRDNQSATNERTFEYSSKDIAPQFYPYSVFQSGDWILIPDGDNAVKDRISQITIDKPVDGSPSLTVLTGDRILSGTSSLAKRQSAQTGGSISGGNQTSPAPLDSRIPSAPVVSTVTSVGYWNTDGAAKSAVTMTWAAVTEALNGADMTCDLYEVWWRKAVGAEWSFRTSTDQLTVEMPGWDVLAALEFRVRGRSVDGIFGEFSEDQEYTTLAPAVDLDGPVIADLYTDGIGSIYIVWAGILGITTAPARLAYVVAEISSDGGTTYTTTGTPIAGPGTIVLNPGVYGTYDIRIRGYDRLGNAGTASASQSIITTDPGISPPTPAAPTDLAATAGASWDASGVMPTAWFDLTWTAPTLDTLGNAVDVVGYDVWGKRLTESAPRFLTSSNTDNVRITVGNDEVWTFQVSAASNFGGVSPLSDSITVTANATIAAPTAPTAPVLSQYAGLLRVQWAGGGMVPQVRYVFASISTVSGGTFTRAGMPLNGAGEVVIPGLATGVTYYAKINLVDERGQVVASAQSAGLLLDPITGVTIQTSPVANTGIKMTSSSLTSYDVSGNPTFILDATTGEVWIAPYDSVFTFGAPGTAAETGAAVTGVSISSENSSFNTFIHPSGAQIRNDQTPLSWWESDATDASLVNFFSPRAVLGQRLRVGDYEMLRESKTTGSRLVIRYKGA